MQSEFQTSRAKVDYDYDYDYDYEYGLMGVPDSVPDSEGRKTLGPRSVAANTGPKEVGRQAGPTT